MGIHYSICIFFQERWLKFQYAIIVTHNAIKDIND